MALYDPESDQSLTLIRGENSPVKGRPGVVKRLDRVLRDGIELGVIKNITAANGGETFISYCGSMKVAGGGPEWIAQTYDMLQSYDEAEEAHERQLFGQ